MSQDQQPDGSVRRSRRNWTLGSLDRSLVYLLLYDERPEVRSWEVEALGHRSEASLNAPVRRDTPTA